MTIIKRKLIQGTEEWKNARVGCITMSNAKALLSGGKGITRKNYLLDVASEMASGVLIDNLKTIDIARGNLLEDYARRAYEEITGEMVEEVGIGYLNKDKRISASPDGLIKSGGIEIKCPNPKAHMRTIVSGSAPKEYIPQMQGCMWVFGVNRWDYVSFSPQFSAKPLHIITQYRDEEIIKKIEESALRGIEEIDEFINIAKDTYSDAVYEICNQSIFALNELYDVEPEII
ncbi:MAG: YqaJ viral recombinase family protein [Methylococcales bacterium]